MGFSPSETYVALYEDKLYPSMTNVVITTEESVTKYIEKYEVACAPYFMVLINIAQIRYQRHTNGDLHIASRMDPI